MKFNSTCVCLQTDAVILTLMTLFSPSCVRKTLIIPITMFRGNYEYFNDVGLDKLIQEVKKIDDYHVQFTLSEPNAAFPADWGMDFASILSAEYADAMLKKGTPENGHLANWHRPVCAAAVQGGFADPLRRESELLGRRGADQTP